MKCIANVGPEHRTAVGLMVLRLTPRPLIALTSLACRPAFCRCSACRTCGSGCGCRWAMNPSSGGGRQRTSASSFPATGSASTSTAPCSPYVPCAPMAMWPLTCAAAADARAVPAARGAGHLWHVVPPLSARQGPAYGRLLGQPAPTPPQRASPQVGTTNGPPDACRALWASGGIRPFRWPSRAAPPAIAQRSPQRILPGLVVAGPRGKARLEPSVPLLLTATTGRLLCVRPRSGRTRKPVGLPGRRRPLRRSLPGRRALPHSRRVARQGDRRQQRNPAPVCVIHLVEHSKVTAQCGMPPSPLSH